MTPPTCTECAGRLGRGNATGQCKRCRPKVMARDPNIRRNQLAGIRRKMADPIYRAEHIARCVRNGRDLTDEQRERRRAHGRRMVARLTDAAAKLTAQQRAENGRKRTETTLAWCPPEWRAKYRDLKKRGRPAAVAKAIVLDLIAGRAEPAKYQRQKAQLAWCPPALRDHYATLRRKVGAPEARRIIEQEIPGTRAHARRQIDNFNLTQRLRAEREAAQSY